MRWSTQVVHVVRKDLRQARWLLLLYLGMVAAATAAAGWEGLELPPGFPKTLPLVLMGGLLLALLVQADPPARSSAFWVTLPLERSAVLAAKLLTAAVVLLAVPLLGQLAALLAHAVPVADLPALLGVSALAYGMWLAAAAAVAALSRDLRTFVAASAAALVAWQLGGSLVRSLLTPAAPFRTAPPNLLLPSVVAAGALLVLAHQYLTRDTRRGVRVAVLLGLVVLALPALASRPAPPTAPAPGEIPERLRPSVRLESARLRAAGELDVSISLAGASPVHEYLLVSPVALLRMPDGSEQRVALDSYQPYVSLGTPKLRLGERLRWLGEPPARPDALPPPTHGMSFDLGADQREALTRPGVQVVLLGHLEVREPRVRADLPLEPGATAAFRRERLRVVEAGYFGDGPSVQVEHSTLAALGSPEQRHHHRPFTPRYALVNRERGEALAMVTGGGSGQGARLVLPGPAAYTSSWQIVPRPGERGERPVEEDWLGQARLLHVEWLPLGSEPIRTDARLVGPGSSAGTRERSEASVGPG